MQLFPPSLDPPCGAITDCFCQKSRLPSATLRSARPRRLATVQARETEPIERPRGARREPRLLQCRYTCSTCRLRLDHWSGSSLCPPSCDPTHVTGVTPHRDALEADPMCLNGQTFGHPASWKSATILQMITGPGSPGSGAARGCAGRWCAPGSSSPLQHLARPRGHSVEGSHQHLNLTHFTSYLILGLCHLWGTNWDFLTVFYDPRCRPNGTGPSSQGPQRTR